MESWTWHLGDGEGTSLAVDDLGVGAAMTSADGVVLESNEVLSDLLGGAFPAGPDALAGMLLAAGVAEPRVRIEASRATTQDLVLRRGGRTRPVRLITRELPENRWLHLFHDLQDSGAMQAHQAELQSLIAHDLRSPLAVIQGYAGLLATGQPGPLNPTQQEFLGGIDAKIVEVTRLLDDFLDLSRLEAGALQLQLQPVSLAEVIGQVCQEQQRAAAARSITVTMDVEPETIEITADPLRLKQVVENLIGNAVKYNGDGGWVRVSAVIDGSDVTIRVADGGPGMDAAELATIFEPFTRGRAGGGVAGSGLGLVVVQRLVDLHGGTITASSLPASGTEFTVRLPRRNAVIEPAPAAVAPQAGGVQ